jgi:hypothetical protein
MLRGRLRSHMENRGRDRCKNWDAVEDEGEADVRMGRRRSGSSVLLRG